jgi:hypothetical protein
VSITILCTEGKTGGGKIDNEDPLTSHSIFHIVKLRLKWRSFPAWCFLYVVPLDPALKGGDHGVLSGQPSPEEVFPLIKFMVKEVGR